MRYTVHPASSPDPVLHSDTVPDGSGRSALILGIASRGGDYYYEDDDEDEDYEDPFEDEHDN